MVHRFAVFGDVHGRVALMLTLARRWQRQTGLSLDAVLQAGDMGAFPDHTRLDDATRRFAAEDRDELGFVDFVTESDDGERLLAPDDTPPIVFCRGNHEDFGYLEPFRAPARLDPWGKLWFVPDGAAFDVGPVRIAAFGGAPPRELPYGPGRRAREQRRTAARRAQPLGLGPRFTDRDLGRALARDHGQIDVLLTHAGPAHPEWAHGSDGLARLAARWRPRAHLFGHHHTTLGPVDAGHGLLVGLEHLFFQRDGRLQPGAWGILTVPDAGDAAFDWVTDPWVDEVTRWTWREHDPEPAATG